MQTDVYAFDGKNGGLLAIASRRAERATATAASPDLPGRSLAEEGMPSKSVLEHRIVRFAMVIHDKLIEIIVKYCVFKH